MTVLSKFAEAVQIEPLTHYYYYTQCWKNALYNLLTAEAHAPVEGKPLHRLVAGSLSTIEGVGIWGTRGLKDPKCFFEDFTACHVWIEDGEGRIWDMLFEESNEKLKSGSKVARIPEGGIEIEGMTALEIETAYGYRFTPAPAECQTHIFNEAFSRFLPLRPYNFHTGSRFIEGWIGIAYKAENTKATLLKNKVFQKAHNFNGVITGSDAGAHLWWRDFMTQPADPGRFHFFIAELNEMFHGEEFARFADTGVPCESVKKDLEEIDAAKSEDLEVLNVLYSAGVV